MEVGKRKPYAEKNTKYVEFPMFSPQSDKNSTKSFTEMFNVNGKEMMIEINAGGAVSIISEKQYQAAFSTETLEITRVKLKTYTGEIVSVSGQLNTLQLIQLYKTW